MKIKAYIEIYDNDTVRDLEAIGLTPKFLEIGYSQLFEDFLEKIKEGQLNYTVSVEVKE